MHVQTSQGHSFLTLFITSSSPSSSSSTSSHPILFLFSFLPQVMPVSPPALPQQQDSLPQSQIKLCSSCRSPLSQDLDPTYFIPDSDVNDHLMLCRPCRERILLQTIQQQQPHDQSQHSDVDDQPHRLHAYPAHPASDDSSRLLPIDGPAPITESSPSVQPQSPIAPSDRPLPTRVAHEAPTSSTSTKRAKLAITTSVTADGLRSAVSSTPSVSSSIRSGHTTLQHSPAPDPFVDITRFRMRSQRHHCLYPGATFQGTQKSGRNSYDVTVSIVVR